MDIQKSLEELLCLLKNANFKVKKDINIFNAVGMSHYETKHSRFLAWLLDPSAPHNLNDKVLNLFSEALLDYNTVSKDKNIQIKSNKLILLGRDFPNENQSLKDKIEENRLKKEYFDLFHGDVKIIPELHLDTNEQSSSGKKKERYIDIFIEIKSNTKKTAIVIENKTESSTHSNQLCAYNDWVHKQGYDREIYVLLSPNGEIPRNFGGDNKYNDKWCV